MELSKKHIPEGPYCYTWKEIPSEKNGYKGKTIKCPYLIYRNINGVQIPWCEYMDAGSIPNGISDDHYGKLIEYFGTEEKVQEKLPLFLLWDWVKECGEKDNWDE
jgi:hypothetical protein